MRNYTGVEICECVIRPSFLGGIDIETRLTQDKAYEPSQKYKEGKYILERNLLVDVQ